MANNNTIIPQALLPKGYAIDNKSMSEMKKKQASVASSVQFRNEVLESQKRVNYQNEFDRLQGAKRLTALHPNVKYRMIDIQHKARQSLKCDSHAIYKFKLICNM